LPFPPLVEGADVAARIDAERLGVDGFWIAVERISAARQ